MSTKDPHKEVVCLVFHQYNKILLEQRLDKDAFYGNWMFPGGKLEPEDYESEDPIKAACIREGSQETGLIPQEIVVCSKFEQKLRDERIFVFYSIHVTKRSGEVQNLEVGRRNLDWKTIEEAKELIGDHEVDKRVLEDFLKTIN